MSKSVSVMNSFGFVGYSLAMQVLYNKIDSVAASSAPVFILGETGTGKELCAEAIHAKSERVEKLFVPVNCGAIPHELLESEMFGHLKGSFTGAIANRDGLAKQADGGTLFLDEICELPFDLQSKLLRFLQTGYIQPIGAARPQKLNVRIICATNKNLRLEMNEGRFREDLFYRLFVLPLKLPPLRARGADVNLIAEHFLTEFNRQESKNFTRFSQEAMFAMENYDWPGNVREVQNAVRLAVVMNDGPVVERAMLDETLGESDHQPILDVSAFQTVSKDAFKPLGFQSSRQLWQIERDAIEAAIVACEGSVPRAAEQLGVSPSTIYRKRETWQASHLA